MKATLTIDDDLLTEAERLAAERAVTVDVIVSDLLRQSMGRIITVRADNGFPVFAHAEGAPPITPEDVSAADEEV